MRFHSCTRRFGRCVLGVLAVVALSPVLMRAQAPLPPVSFEFTSFDYPGSTFTAAIGINKSGIVTGDYLDAESVFHGFVRLASGTFKQLDYPGAVLTFLGHANDSNQVVGYYVDSSGADHGFLFVPPNHFTSIDYPGATGTRAEAINNSGQIVGTWDTDSQEGGFSLVNGTYTSFVHRDSSGMIVSDVNSSGVISGTWIGTDGQAHPFLLSSAVKGKYLEVKYPGAVNTAPFGLDDKDQVVGDFMDTNNVTHGWGGAPLHKKYVMIDYPGSSYCQVVGITDAGHLTGSYVGADGAYHGFLAVPK